jgi:co-chaperonin GroES (HSP10)
MSDAPDPAGPLNTSGIRPTGYRILVRPDPIEEKTASGLVVVTGEGARREQMRQTWGLLVAVGPAAWAEHPEERVAPGTRIMFGAYSGLVHKGDDSLDYRIINDRDVCAVKDTSDGN